MKPEKPIIVTKVKGSKPNTEYTVAIYETFETCTCPGFLFRKNCKHTEIIRALVVF